MTPLHLVKPAPQKGRLTVDELLALLGPDKLDVIDRTARIMREAYDCPYTVRDYEAFKDTLFDFFAHYQKTFFNADLKLVISSKDDPSYATYWKGHAYDFVQQHLTGYKGDIRTAERNAITGREGGMITVIDALTDGIIKLHTETYIRSVFFDRIAPSDYATRLRLAHELLKKYGPFLFPGEDLQPYYILGMNLEHLFQAFVTHLHALRREWRH